MVFYTILKIINVIKMAFIDWIPAVENPTFFTEQLPIIMDRIMLFNDYIPIVECIEVVTYLLLTTLGWKIIKVVVGIVNINLGA